MIVVSGFDRSTKMVEPWAEAGYTCYCIDIEHPDGETREGNIIKVGADILKWNPPTNDVKISFFFPPCTDIAVSGARWFKDKGLGALIDALVLFKRAVDLSYKMDTPYMIENPVSTVSSYWREPNYTFQPWQYGDMYTKKTCLWTGNFFKMPKPIYTKRPKEVTDKIHKMPPSLDRAYKRSITPSGFARAVYESNKWTYTTSQITQI